jgi:hypothetical protein
MVNVYQERKTKNGTPLGRVVKLVYYSRGDRKTLQE